MESQPVPPAPPAPAAGDRKGFAIAGFVIGILDLCAWLLPICGGPLAVISLVLSILGLKSSQRILAIIGVVLSAVAIVLVIANAILGAVLNSGSILQQIQSALGASGY